MRLTPADVHNVAFKKPSIGKRGYDEDEVDAFLDLIEAELARLIEENNELTRQVSANSNGAAPQVVAEAPAQPVESQPGHAQPVAGHTSAAEPAAAQSHADAPVSVEKASAADAEVAAPHVQAARLLGLAQETADRLLADAQAEAATLLTDAHSRSEALVTEATAKAEALDQEAQGKYAQAIDKLTTDRSTLERKIDDLRVYEREYRSRLKSWISEQLVQLEEGGAQRADAEQHVQV